MRYISTRGQAPARDFAGVLLAGLAEDGGLFVPETWPAFSPADWRAMRGLSYPDLAARVMQPFVGDAIPSAVLATICHDAYAGFGHPAVVPLVQLETHLFAQELFHGPTLAFKDMAMQVLGLLFDHVLTERDARVTIVGATSGDTGSAAIEACAGRDRIDIVILHPHERTSHVQRRQMTTVLAPNVGNVAIEGTFDDCQDLVKAHVRRRCRSAPRLHLSAVNSINWARIAAQIPYYVASALALGAPDREVAFTVPTGNFGNILAAWAARRMGLPVARLIVGSNRNDILSAVPGDATTCRWLPVEPSLSPSMDIQVSSNFERLLFELLRPRPGRHRRRRCAASATPAGWRFRTRPGIGCARCSTASGWTMPAPLAEIRRLHEACGYLADPHTAIGIAAARAHPPAHGVPTVAMATAHPAKFPDAIEQAVGIRPAIAAPAGGSDGAGGAFRGVAERPPSRRGQRAKLGWPKHITAAQG